VLGFAELEKRTEAETLIEVLVQTLERGEKKLEGSVQTLEGGDSIH
jgi:exonuclease VII small subunit